MTSSTSLLRPEQMRGYQTWMAEQVYQQNALLLASFMGSGKTVSVLTALRRLLDEFAVTRVLIVAPLLVAETVWPDEIESWTHLRALRYEVLTGNEERRLSRMRIPAEIHIINRENVPWLWNRWKKKWPYDCIVWDESSRLKAGKKRTSGAGKMSEFGAICAGRAFSSRVIELTGTPAPNGLQDLWGQIYLLDGGERLGTKRDAFLGRWFYSESYKTIPYQHSEDEIMSRIRDVMLCLKEEDYADLPPLVRNVVEAPMPQKAMEQYRRFEKTLVAEDYDVEAMSKGVLTNKLLQFSNGSLYNEYGDDLHIHDAKIKALERIVDEAAGQPILVAYSFRFDLKRILKKYPKAEVLTDNSSDIVKRWNQGKIQMLLAHPASAGHGLNLQKGGSIAVWYGINWSLELYQQFNKRLHRGSQERTVFLHHIISPGTMDGAVMDALNRKGATQDSVTNAVRVKLKKVA